MDKALPSSIVEPNAAAISDRQTAAIVSAVTSSGGGGSPITIHIDEMNVRNDQDNNPENFSDTYNGTGATIRSNKRVTTSDFIKAWGYDSNDPSFIYPSTVGGSENTYICDKTWYAAGTMALAVGGRWSNASYVGPFVLDGSDAPALSSANIGSRLQKLPSKAA